MIRFAAGRPDAQMIIEAMQMALAINSERLAMGESAVMRATLGGDPGRDFAASDPGCRQVERAATIAPKSAALRLAPPTSAPSTCGTAKISTAFEGLTDPP